MKAKKKFGQNFLVNDTIINNIVSLFNVHNGDLIIEIGPGRGALTKHLISSNANYIGIEIDGDMHQYLNKYINSNVQFIYDDILNIDLTYFLEKYEYQNLYIIGNLPYYITTPIIDKIISSKIKCTKMIFMVQKEVAERLTAKACSSEYGYMTIYCNYYYDVQYEFTVKRDNFNPIPNVDSAIISLNYKDTKPVSDDFWDFIKLAFKFKRKKLKNNLEGYDWNIIKEVLDKYSIKENVRAEELSLNIFWEIYNNINGGQNGIC